MAISSSATAWIEPRKGRRGYRTFHVRAERGGVRFPSLACGTDRDHAIRIRDGLRQALIQRAGALEAVLVDWLAKKIPSEVFAEDIVRLLTSGDAPARHRATTEHTIGELEEKYLREAKRDKSARSVEIDTMALARLATFAGRDRPLNSVTGTTIAELRAQMKGMPRRRKGADGKVAMRDDLELSKTSEAIYLFALRAAFNRARKNYKWIIHDPFDGLAIFRVGSKGRLIHNDEFERVRPEAQKVVRGGRSLWEALDVMRHQGLRTGAIEALDGRMVNRQTRHLHLIKPARLGIGRDAALKNTELYAPIHRDVWSIFESAPAAGLIFEGWRRGEIAKELRKICDRLKIPRFRPHDLKHTFVTNFLKGGGTIDMCSAITGTSANMLRRVYKHLEGKVPPAEMDRVSYAVSPTTPQKRKAASPR